MTKREKKRQWWRERLEEQKQSDLSMAQFCREQNISYNNMQRWKAVFLAEIEKNHRSSTFLELVTLPKTEMEAQAFDLTCGSCQLKVSADLEADHLTRIIVAMNRAAVILC
jgi:hypothetical protein